MVGEITDQTNRPDGLAIVYVSWAVGSSFGYEIYNLSKKISHGCSSKFTATWLADGLPDLMTTFQICFLVSSG